MTDPLVGARGLVTTSIPVGGLGEVRLTFGRGSDTYGAYSSNRGVPIPSGTAVTVIEVYPPRTVVVSADG
jgi:hypothetical protein